MCFSRELSPACRRLWPGERVSYCHCFFFSSRRRHTRLQGDWSSDVCSSDLLIFLAEDLPERNMRRGRPTGAAMPLCWSHAEYVSLVRSAHDGISFDRVEPAFQQIGRASCRERV